MKHVYGLIFGLAAVISFTNAARADCQNPPSGTPFAQGQAMCLQEIVRLLQIINSKLPPTAGSPAAVPVFVVNPGREPR